MPAGDPPHNPIDGPIGGPDHGSHDSSDQGLAADPRRGSLGRNRNLRFTPPGQDVHDALADLFLGPRPATSGTSAHAPAPVPAAIASALSSAMIVVLPN